jgi:flagella basal body P-ring formation protein FlgA
MTLILAGGLSVELKPEAKVRGTELQLGEIALVKSEDAELAERARLLSVGYAPAPGFSRRLDQWSLRRELQQVFQGVELEFGGAEACRIVPETQTVTSADLVAAARAELVSAFAASDVTYELQAEANDLEIPVGRSARTLNAQIDQNIPASGILAVPVEVRIDGELYRTVYTNWRVETWREVPVLVRDVSVGESLNTSLFRRDRVRIGVVNAGAHLTERAADGAVAVRNLRAGAVVASRDVRRPRMVRRGDTVQLEVRKGNIRATSSAVATDDGFLGDKIRVVTRNQNELRAVIVGRELVSIDLTGSR